MKHRRATALLCLAGVCLTGVGPAQGEPLKSSPRGGLLGGKIDDLPIRLSLPISKESSLVVQLAEHYWIRCVPTLDAIGYRLDFKPNLSIGGAACNIGIGVVPLPEAEAGEAPADRVRRSASALFSGLGDYWKGYFKLVLDADRIKTEGATLKIDGRKVSALRASKFNMKSNSVDRPDVMYTCDCIAVNLEGTDTLVYFAYNNLNSKSSIDDVVASLSVQKHGAINKSGRRIALLEATADAAGRAIERFACFDDAPGFVPSFTLPPSNGRVFEEDRFDEKGALTASLRVTHRPPAEVSTPDAEGKFQMQLMDVEQPGAARKIDLATKGVQAVAYSHKASLDGRDGAANTAVFRFDDQIWCFSWYTFGDDPRVKADQTAFDALLHKVQVAER